MLLQYCFKRATHLHYPLLTFVDDSLTSLPGRRNNRPEVIKVSPGTSPVSTWTFAESLTPVVISMGSALLLLKTNTCFFLPCGTTALFGIMRACGLFPRTICTFAKVPGIKAGSVFFTMALTVRLLVSSPTVVSVAMTAAENVFSDPFNWNETNCPFLICEPYFSGTLN